MTNPKETTTKKMLIFEVSENQEDHVPKKKNSDVSGKVFIAACMFFMLCLKAFFIWGAATALHSMDILFNLSMLATFTGIITLPTCLRFAIGKQPGDDDMDKAEVLLDKLFYVCATVTFVIIAILFIVFLPGAFNPIEY